MKRVSRVALHEKIISLPRFNLNNRQLCDLELLLCGGFNPLSEFMGRTDYDHVVNTMRLGNNSLFPIPLTLDTDDAELFKGNKEIILCDAYGNTLALLYDISIYEPDKNLEAMKVYKTLDERHNGVNYLMNRTGKYYVGGKVKKINTIARYDFASYRHTPGQLKKWFFQNKWKKVIGFQTRNPLHKVHFELLTRAMDEYKGNVLIHPAVGETKLNDIDYVTRVRSYIAFYKNYFKKNGKLSLLPLAMRMAGPREALWHAIIRKNYGCTHFIVGRDHAGPDKNIKGVPFYKVDEALRLALKHEKELGIKIIPFKELVYVPKKKRYMSVDKAKGYKTRKISGTKLKEVLLNNDPVPEWFSFPEVLEELNAGLMSKKRDGLTIFFTGLPSSGKSTIAHLLYYKLLEIQHKPISYFDGDNIRQILSKGLGFSKKDRNTNIERIGYVANEITKHGGIAICAAIAPYASSRRTNRKRIEQFGTYVEIYVSTPKSVCIKRDTKGLYKKALAGKIKNFTGMDDPYEIPKNPEIKLNTTNKTPQGCVNEILTYLEKSKLITIEKMPV